MHCVCCLQKSDNKKQLRTFTASDGRLYHELTKLQIILNKPKICFDCKSALKSSTEFLRLCFKSYAELTSTEQDVEEETRKTRSKPMPVLEEETLQLDFPMDDNDPDSDELPISILKQQLQKDKDIINFNDRLIVQTGQDPVITEEIKDQKVTPKGSKKKISRFICNDCGISFSTSQRLQIHSFTHSGIKNWKCDDCEKVFATKFRLKAHTRTHTGERPFVCDVCSLAFAQGNALKCHKRIHTKERPFVCKICSKSFSQNTTLKTHMAALHLGKTVECDEPGCTKKFTRRSYLLIHMRDHAGERKYACDRCPNQYKQKSHLDRHIEASHLGIRHKCTFPGCTSEFSKAWSLKMHRFAHTSENNLLPYQCQLCGIGFQRRDKLLKHRAKIHEASDVDCVKVENEIAAVDASNLDKTNFVVLTTSPEIYTIHNLDGSVTQVQTLEVVEEK